MAEQAEQAGHPATPKQPAPGRHRRPHHGRWTGRLAVAGIATVLFVVRLTPLGLARCLARTLGRVIYFFAGPRRLGVERHLHIAFGSDLPPERVRALAKGFWKHVCEAVVEAAHLKHWDADAVRRRVDLSDLPKLEAAAAPGKGLILVSGHMGSWEVGPYALSLLGKPVKLVHNPGTVEAVFEYVTRQRERSGMQVISRLQHPWALKKLIDRGAWLCIAADLNAGRRGAFVPFFGVQASSYLSPAALQRVTGCPIVVATTARQPGGRHKLHVWRVIPGEKNNAPDDAALKETTRQLHEALEAAIRAYPEQWLWNYRRWRSRPKDETPGPDGLPPRVAAVRQPERAAAT